MKKLLFLALPLMLLGCAHVSGTRSPDGTLAVKSTRWFWTTSDLDFGMTEGTNMTVTLKAKHSGSDAEAMAAVAEAVARGVASGVVKP